MAEYDLSQAQPIAPPQYDLSQAQLIDTPPSKPGVISEALKGVGRGFGALARVPAVAAYGGANLIGGEESAAFAQKYYLDPLDRLRETLAPAPEEQQNLATRVAGGVGEFLPSLALGGLVNKGLGALPEAASLTDKIVRGLAVGGAAFGLPQAVNQATDAVRAGDDLTTSFTAGAVGGATGTAMGIIPASVPGNLLTRAATGAAAQVGLGEAQREIANAVFSEHPDQQTPFTGAGAATNAVIGALMGGVLGPRAGTKPEAKPTELPPAETPPAEAPPAAPTKPPASAADLLSYATARLDELERKAKGAPEQQVTGEDGTPQTIPAVQPEYLTEAEKAERAFLTQSGSDAAAVAGQYGLRLEEPPTPEAVHADLAGQHAAATQQVADLTPALAQTQQTHDDLIAKRDALTAEAKLPLGERRTKSDILTEKKAVAAQLKDAKAKLEEVGGQLNSAKKSVETLTPQVEAAKQALTSEAPPSEVTPAMHEQLSLRGFEPEHIAQLAPEQAAEAIRTTPTVEEAVARARVAAGEAPATPTVDPAVAAQKTAEIRGLLDQTKKLGVDPKLTDADIHQLILDKGVDAADKTIKSLNDIIAGRTGPKLPKDYAQRVAAQLGDRAKEATTPPSTLQQLHDHIDATIGAKKLSDEKKTQYASDVKSAIAAITSEARTTPENYRSTFIKDEVAKRVGLRVNAEIKSDIVDHIEQASKEAAPAGAAQKAVFMDTVDEEAINKKYPKLVRDVNDALRETGYRGVSVEIAEHLKASNKNVTASKKASGHTGIGKVAGGFDTNQNTIILSAKVLSKLSKADIVEFIAHEAEHAKQHAAGDSRPLLEREADAYRVGREARANMPDTLKNSRAGLTQEEFERLPPRSQAAASDAYGAAMANRGHAMLDRLAQLVGDRPDLDAKLFTAGPGDPIGSYARVNEYKSVISMALNAKSAPGVADHEGYHYAEDRLLTAAERRITANALTEGKPLFEQLVQKLQQYDRENQTDLVGEVTSNPAEARAYAFEFWRRGELDVTGHLARAWQKLQQFFEKVSNAVKGLGFKSADDVFTALDHGEMATRALDTGGSGQTQTPAFKNWFGDSKVVDAEGKPLVVYHGSPADIEAFDPAKSPIGNRGLYFTTNNFLASVYARDSGAVYPVYLSIKNPLILDGQRFDPKTLKGRIARLLMPDAYRAAVANNKMRDTLSDGDTGRVFTQNDVAALKAAGYDGVVTMNAYPEKIQVMVVFDPAQVKSAAGNTGAFDPNNPDIRRSQAGDRPWYRSALTEAVEAIPSKQASAQGWKEQIKGLIAKGTVKKDELDAVGLNDYLDLQPGKVSKEQVVAFLKENGVQVRDVTLGGKIPAVITSADDPRLQVITQADGSHDVLLDGKSIQTYNPGSDLKEVREWAIADANEAIERGKPKPAETKFSGYQLPGGENYKELLLTLPPKGMDAAAVIKRDGFIDASNKDTIAPAFQSSHFDQPNILAHVRFNERTDAEGRKVLFLEELQSDWAQKGRKEGFKQPLEKLVASKTEAGYWEIKTDSGRFVTNVTEHMSEADALAEAQKRYESDNPIHVRQGVPSAPFVGKTEAWVALALKRMIRYAAEHGFDRVAWTTGEQQAARYDLSKQVSRIEYADNGNGRYHLGAFGLDGRIAINEVMDADKLEDVVGKEIAKKIVEGAGTEEGAKQSGHKVLAGVDLKVGGEGMKGFYDKIVPGVANDVLKKLGGGKVGSTTIDIQGNNGLNTATEYQGPAFTVADLKPLADARNYDVPAAIQQQLTAIAKAMNEGIGYKQAMEAQGSMAAARLIGGDMVAKQNVHSSQPSFDITPQMAEAAANGLPLFSQAAKEAEEFNRSPIDAGKVVDRTASFLAQAADRIGTGNAWTRLNTEAFRHLAQWKTVQYLNHQADVHPELKQAGVADGLREYREAHTRETTAGTYAMEAPNKVIAAAQKVFRTLGDEVKVRALNRDMQEIGVGSSMNGTDFLRSGAANRIADQTLTPRQVQRAEAFHQQYLALQRSNPEAAQTLLTGALAHRQQLVFDVAHIARELLNKTTDPAAQLVKNMHATGLDMMAKDVREARNGDTTRFYDGASFTLDRRLQAAFKATAGLQKDSLLREQMNELRDLYYQQVRSPYFSAGRQGDYFANVGFKEMDDATWARMNAAIQSHGIILGDHQGQDHIFVRTETPEEAAALRRKLTDAAGNKVDLEQNANGPLAQAPQISNVKGISKAMRSILDTIQEALPNNAEAQNVRDALMRKVMSMIPETASRSAAQLRRNVPGYDADFLGAFGRRAQGGAQDTARIYAAPLFTQAFKTMDQSMVNLNKSGSEDAKARGGIISDELRTRHNNLMKPSDNSTVNTINSISHAFYLGGATAFYIRTMAQPFHRGLPILGSRYGFYDSAKEILHGQADALKVIAASVKQAVGENGIKGALDADFRFKDMGFTPKEEAFLQELHDRGILKLGQARQMADLALTGVQHGQDAIRALSMTAGYAEMTNRLATGIAAFRLAERGKAGLSQQGTKANTEYAVKTIVNAMDDFDQYNTARAIGRNGVAGKVTPLLTQFMNYSLQTMQQIARTVQDGVFNKDQSPEGLQRSAEAKKEFAGLMATTAMISGGLGLPFANAIAGVYNQLTKDEDDPSDIRLAARNALADALGTKGGELAAHGLGGVLGVDTASFGLQNLLPGSEFLASRRLMKDRLDESSAQLMGPALNVGMDLALGLSKMSDGYYVKGIEQMLPSALKGYWKAGELATRGYTDSKGNPIALKPSGWDIGVQSLGLRPQDKAEQAEAANYFGTDQYLLQHRKAVLEDQVYKAVTQGTAEDQQAAFAAATKFSRQNPLDAIRDWRGMFRAHALSLATAASSETGVGVSSPRLYPKLGTKLRAFDTATQP